MNPLRIGADVTKQLEYDHAAEADAIKTYNAAIKLATDGGDYATHDVLKHILNDEDEHIDGIEKMQDQLSHMTLPVFLTTQVG